MGSFSSCPSCPSSSPQLSCPSCSPSPPCSLPPLQFYSESPYPSNTSSLCSSPPSLQSPCPLLTTTTPMSLSKYISSSIPYYPLGCSLSNLVMDKGIVSLNNTVSSVILPFSFQFYLPPIVLVTVDCTFFDQAYVTNITTSQCTVSFSIAIGKPCTVRYIALGYVPSILPVIASTSLSTINYFLPAINASNIVIDYGYAPASATSISTGTIPFNFTFASSPIVLLGTDCTSGVGATSVNISNSQFTYFLSQAMGTPCTVRYLAIGEYSSTSISTLSPTISSNSINTTSPNFGSTTWNGISVTTPNTVLDCGVFYSTSDHGIVQFNISFSSLPYVFVQSPSQYVSSVNITTTQFSYSYSASATSSCVITYIAIGTVS